MKIEQLMASILRSDLNRVIKILRQLENGIFFLLFELNKIFFEFNKIIK